MTEWTEKEKKFAGKIEEQACEIERLRFEYAEIALRARQSAIEECARVVEENFPAELYPYNPGSKIAAAIRALKDKP